MFVHGDQVTREPGGLRPGESRPHPNAFRSIVPLGDRRSEIVERRQHAPIRVRNEEAHVLEAIREQFGDSPLQRIEPLTGLSGDQECSRIRVLDPASSERVERVGLVQDELDGNVVRPDVAEHLADRTYRLRETLFGERRVRNVQDQIGDESLLEGRCEPLHELRRKPPNEPDGVGHEVALPVVLERAGRGIESLEQAIVDGGIGAGERVQERRFSDVRIAGESDGRSSRAHPLLASRRALALKRAQAPFEQRDTRTSKSAVGLELTLSRPARPDTAAQALEVLPHASHARKVVFELGELDLELAFGRARVLSKDVEDQLRAVDYPRTELVLE